MGIAYLLMLIVYIALAKGIYAFIKNYIGMKWANKIALVILILIPTYDIIIGNALKFYYCQFTELEKINKTIERPDGVLLIEQRNTYDKEYSASTAETYIQFRKLKYIQIKYTDDHMRTYVSVGEYIDHNDAHRLKIEEINNSSLKAPYSITIDGSVVFPSFANYFLRGFETKIIDTQTGEVIAWTKTINHKKYNFITIDTGYFLRGKWCGSSADGALLEKIIKKDNK